MIELNKKICEEIINVYVKLAQIYQKIGKTPRVADLGEFIVCKQLFDQFKKPKIIYKPHGRCDLILKREACKNTMIEVKTSNYKSEDYGTGWGFALNVNKCKKKGHDVFIHTNRGKLKGDFCYFDYLICVILPINFNKFEPNFLIFSRAYLEEHKEEMENKSKRFSYAPYRILLPIKERDPNLISNFDRYLMKNRDKFGNWDILKCDGDSVNKES